MGPRLAATPSLATLAPWREEIQNWLEKDQLQLSRVLKLLKQEGCGVPLAFGEETGRSLTSQRSKMVGIPRLENPNSIEWTVSKGSSSSQSSKTSGSLWTASRDHTRSWLNGKTG